MGTDNLFRNDAAGHPARMEFRYINDSGVSTTMASFDSAGWVFEQAMQAANGLVVNGNPVTFNQQLTVNANTFLNGTLSSDSGAIFTDGSGDLTIGNGLTLTPKMAHHLIQQRSKRGRPRWRRRRRV